MHCSLLSTVHHPPYTNIPGHRQKSMAQINHIISYFNLLFEKRHFWISQCSPNALGKRGLYIYLNSRWQLNKRCKSIAFVCPNSRDSRDSRDSESTYCSRSCTIGPESPHPNAFRRLVQLSRKLQRVCSDTTAHRQCVVLEAGQHATNDSLSENT